MALGYAATVTINHAKLGSADVADLPVFVSFSVNDLKTVANTGKVQNASGFDICFFSDSALTSKLKWQTLAWSATAGTWSGWIRIPTATHSVDAVVYAGIGDATITTDQSDTVNTWRSSFKRVLHLDDGTTLSGADATGTAAVTNSSASAASVKVRGGVQFNGSGFMSGANTSLPSPASAFTIAFWWNADAQGSSVGRIISWNNGTRSLQIGRLVSGVFLATGTSGDVQPQQSQQGSDPAGLEFIVFTFDGTSTYKTFINGSDVSLQSYGNADITLYTGDSTTLYLGQRGNGSGISALLDELWMEAGAISASEILARYNNQNDPSTFTTLGTFAPVTSSPTPSGTDLSLVTGAAHATAIANTTGLNLSLATGTATASAGGNANPTPSGLNLALATGAASVTTTGNANSAPSGSLLNLLTGTATASATTGNQVAVLQRIPLGRWG